MNRGDRWCRRLLAVTAATLLVAGCGGPQQSLPEQSAADQNVVQPTPAPDEPDQPAASSTPIPAQEARTAASERVRIRPEEAVLSEGTVVPIVSSSTIDGVLTVPENINRAGWWDGSAYAGDPYGHTVLAGHVDSAQEGLGAFAKLLKVKPGASITIRGQGHTAAYRVVTVRKVDKNALADSSGALDQAGPHRLVLITCTGTFDPVERSYDSNLVVTAEPVGQPAP